MPEEYRMNTGLYREIYQKQGIHYGLRSYLVHDGKIIGNISIFNAREKGDFTVKDVTILDTLAPHIALRLARLLEEEREGKVISGPYLDLTRRFGLTVRESEVVSKVASGKGDREIAGDLCISVSTVKKHLHNIYQKTGVSSRTQLLALLHGLPGGASKLLVAPSVRLAFGDLSVELAFGELPSELAPSDPPSELASSELALELPPCKPAPDRLRGAAELNRAA